MKQLFFLLSSIIYFFFTGCAKDVSIDSIVGKWEVISVYKGKVYDNKTNNTYILNFKDDKKVSIKLDVNTCVSEYTTSCDNCINISPIKCTEACCDSDFAIKLIEVIGESKKYDINSDILTLRNIGEIKLKRVFD